MSVPTTYSGAEWAPSVLWHPLARSPDPRRGSGTGAHPAGIVYSVPLTLELPRSETAGTALNALAHCAEALYGPSRSELGRRCPGRRRCLP